jgi:hypothetical protein
MKIGLKLTLAQTKVNDKSSCPEELSEGFEKGNSKKWAGHKRPAHLRD